jgi:hypothetical protein
MKVMAIAQSAITKAFFDQVVKAFRPVEVTPDTGINDIMFSAGEQRVIEYLSRYVRENMLTGVAEVIVKPNDA